MSLHDKFAHAYARTVVRRPAAVLLVLALLAVASGLAASRLTINSNQLDLISQDLPEVKEVKRVIDMVGGAGYLMLALRSEDAEKMKKVSDDLAGMLRADKQNVRFVTYRTPVDFVQEKMVLFVKTEDLVEVKKRLNAYLQDQVRRNNPFFIEIQKTEPVKLDVSDIVAKYSKVGQKSILDDYYISDDRKMLLVLIKPMWDSNELGKTAAYLDKLRKDLEAYGTQNAHGVKLVEDYKRMGDSQTIAYGFTGTYKTSVDDSYAIQSSLDEVVLIAFVAIALVTGLFFRKVFPTVIVMFGTVLGTLYTMGFTYATVGQLNMITSILAGILMGFGVDYGIHFTFRTRLELGSGKPYDQAIHDAIVFAGRPALVAAVVTGGSFAVLMVSEFRGFSQFGFLSAFGSLIIGVTLFAFCPAVLSLLGLKWPDLPRKLIGVMEPPKSMSEGKELRISKPGLVLGLCVAVVAVICAFAVPWTDSEYPREYIPTLWERFKAGVRFDYNTRALMPEDQFSVQLQDEINERFKISSDPIAVYSKDLADAKELYDEVTGHPEKYSSVAQVVSVYTFVPPPESAAANAKVLEEWQEELKDFDTNMVPAEYQGKVELFKKILAARPYGVNEVPEIYASQFRHLPTTRPENHGYLTFLYPGVDLWDGKKMLQFADQTSVIRTASGKEFRAAGQPILFAKLARIVLWDGKVTVILATLWILLMHYLDFRSVKLAAASVIPLGVGVWMMLGLMSITNQRLNFMNIVMLPILLGFGVSHGLYLLHRFLEGTSPVVALRSVGAAVAASTLTTIAGFASLLFASHNGLKSMGVVACLGLATTLLVSFTVLAAVLQLIHDQRVKRAA